MSEEQTKAREADEAAEQPENEQPESKDQAEAPQDASPEGDADALQQQIDSLQSELEEARGDRLRAIAELENVRKRARRDVENAHKFAVEKLAGELLGVKDSLEMGLQAVDGEKPSLEQLREGKEMTLRQLVGVLERAGVEELDPQGKRFDPEFHEAMTMQESAEHAPDTVITVIQKGYLLKGRLLRPARVIVARAADEGGEADDSAEQGA